MLSRKCFLQLWVISLIVFSNQTSRAADFQASLYLRGDTGDEVNTQSGLTFPDNLIDRNYFEALLTAELLLKKIPLGKQLRMGLRMLELQASKYDKDYTNLQDARRIDDKIYAQWLYGNWEVWAGDVTETFGRGLTLSLFENRDLYFDSGVRGGKTVYRSNNLRFKAVYGRSREWFNVEQEGVGGVNAEIRPATGHFMGVNLTHQEGISYERRLTPGVYGGFRIGPITFYGEYAQRRLEDGKDLAGDGTYFSVDATMLGFAAQLGYKYYNWGVENPFQTPPIVQREITTHLLSRHPHLPRIDDQVGFEVNLSTSPTELLFFEVDFARSSKHSGCSPLPTLNQEDEAFWELFGESEVYTLPTLTLKFGAGQNEEAYPTFWEKKTGVAGEAIYNISDLWSSTLSLENMWVNDLERHSKHYEQFASITLSRASLISFNVSLEKSSLDSRVEGNQWVGSEVALNIKKDHRLLLFYGQERGGIKCTSGVCRTVQSFEGFRLTYDGRF